MKTCWVLIFVLINLVSAGCDREEEVTYPNTPPVVKMSSTTVEVATGAQLMLNAELSDAFGLKYAKLECLGIGLNKLVEISTISEIVTSQNFSYSHAVPLNTPRDSYELLMTVKNLTGQIVEKKIIVKVI